MNAPVLQCPVAHAIEPMANATPPPNAGLEGVHTLGPVRGRRLPPAPHQRCLVLAPRGSDATDQPKQHSAARPAQLHHGDGAHGGFTR